MKVIYNNIIPFPGYIAINLFTLIFVRKDLAHKFNAVSENHEAIHTAQMKETLFVGFYLLYLLFWIFRLLQSWSFDKAYYNISFEQEALEFEKDFTYLERRQPYAWIGYQLKRIK